MSVIRPINKYDMENSLISSKGHFDEIQIAYKPKDKKDLPKLLENYRKVLIGLRIKTDGVNYIKREGPEPIFRIPETIETCKEAAQYMREFKTIDDLTDCFAKIGYNSKIVVANTHHVFADGGFVHAFTEHCLDDEIKNPVNISIPGIEVYKDVIVKSGEQAKIFRDRLLTNRQLSQIPTEGHFNIKNNIIQYEFPVSRLQCYDPKLKRPVKLTEYQWVAGTLAMNTFANNFERFAINTAYNARSFLKNKELNWGHLYHITIPSVCAENHSMDLTLKQLGQEFRKYFDFLCKNELIYGAFFVPYEHTYPASIFMSISNVGPIHLPEKLDDMFYMNRSEGIGCETFMFYSTYSRVKKDSNIYTTNFRFPTEAISRKTAQIINDSMYHLLVDVPVDTKLCDAVEELRDFQQKLKKDY